MEKEVVGGGRKKVGVRIGRRREMDGEKGRKERGGGVGVRVEEREKGAKKG